MQLNVHEVVGLEVYTHKHVDTLREGRTFHTLTIKARTVSGDDVQVVLFSDNRLEVGDVSDR